MGRESRVRVSGAREWGKSERGEKEGVQEWGASGVRDLVKRERCV